MDLPAYRQLYQKMLQANAETRRRCYVDTCSKLTNLQRAELVTEMFTPQERQNLAALLAQERRWVQLASVHIYCEALQKMGSQNDTANPRPSKSQ